MPPEMLQVKSGSATTASAKTVLEVSQEIFLRNYLFQPHRGIITEPDTEAGEPSLEQYFSDSSGLQETLQKERMRRALQARLAIALQPQKQPPPIIQVSQEQIASSQEAEGVERVIFSTTTLIESVSPEAARRLSGHESTVQAVCSLAKEEARARGLSLLKIEVRPAWSHEYDERTGIVIDVEIRASSDERFSYWDAVCERLSRLEDLLPPQEQRFLQDQAFFVVNEG